MCQAHHDTCAVKQQQLPVCAAMATWLIGTKMAAVTWTCGMQFVYMGRWRTKVYYQHAVVQYTVRLRLRQTYDNITHTQSTVTTHLDQGPHTEQFQVPRHRGHQNPGGLNDIADSG